MHQILNRRPGKTTDHAEPPKPRTAHNKISAELERQVRDMLRDGIAGKAVARRLGISQNAVYRVLSEMRPTGTAVPTSRKTDYRKILAEAQAEAARRLAERRRELKQQGVMG
jgi:transposase